MEDELPPGQREEPLQRFGLPQFAKRSPTARREPMLSIGGAVGKESRVAVAEFVDGLQRVDQRSDLHCVTTWTATDLAWSGWRFADVLDRVAALVAPDPKAVWLLVRGADGYASCIRQDDALRPDVLLADSLDGSPLRPDEGAPFRLVAPAQYGYKSVKHVVALEYRLHYDSGSAGWMAHPRGRVLAEERSTFLPGAIWRRIWGAALPLARRAYRR